MRNVILSICWAIPAAAVVYLAVGGSNAALVDRPVAAVGLGLIGLGACIQVRRNLAAASE